MDDIFVLDSGADTFRAGRSIDFPSDDEPRTVLPSEVRINTDGGSENVPANQADEHASSQDNLRKIYDVNGAIQYWDGFEAMVSHILYDQLGWPPGDEQFVIATDNVANSRQDREMITKLMFETFNVTGYYIVDSAVSSLYSMGKTQGVVIDIGHSGTDISQVLDGAVMPAMSQRFELGGTHLDAYLQSMLSQRGEQLSARQIRHLKEKIASVHESSDAFQSALATETESVPYTLPDDQKVNITTEGHKLGEALLSPTHLPSDLQQAGVRMLGIAEAAYACVMQQTEPLLRRIQFENMLVCGGVSCIPNLPQRFVKEIKQLVTPSTVPALILAPEYMPEKVTRYPAFMGAAILSKVVNPVTHFVSKADYEDYGPTVVLKKC